MQAAVDRLFSGETVLCDGAMGTMLYSCGVFINRCYDELNVTQPEVVRSVHEGYLQAGAQVIETNTFGANAFRLETFGLRGKVAEFNRAGAAIARQCVDAIREKQAAEAFVAGAVGSLGVKLEPAGKVTLAEARAAFAEQIAALAAGGVDLLILETMMSLDEAEQALDDFNSKLQAVLDEVRERPVPVLENVPVSLLPDDPPSPATGVAKGVLQSIATATMTVPEGFTIHPKLARQFTARAEQLEGGEVDWSLGEAMALGSLLLEGTDVRFVGQDTRRGTFSQRHAALVDYATGDQYVPLCHLDGATGRLTIRDSLLSEYAGLGFEYGYSVERPETLVAWEAQFGDFVNGAEIIIDNFLVAAEDKWGQRASLAMLLPHGYEGQGPEHSSGRIERFLSLSARNNIRVAQPTTSAQYFHLLRSQVLRQHPTPLIVFTPKSMLRAAATRSPLADFERGSFQTVLDDRVSDVEAVTRVVLASGKVAHEAIARRDAISASTIAVVRVEQLYPWPAEEIERTLALYPNVVEVIWLQEEPENMGAWPFVHLQMHDRLRHLRVVHVARAESASPATGSSLVHAAEQADLLVRAVG